MIGWWQHDHVSFIINTHAQELSSLSLFVRYLDKIYVLFFTSLYLLVVACGRRDCGR